MGERADRARALFLEGYNCCQAVFAAFAPDLGLDFETALRLSSGLGGGMGRLREVCGTCSGIFMAAGLLYGYTDPKAREEKTETYAMIQELAAEFRERHGSIICRELLGLAAPEGTPQAEERTPEYYRKRPCPDLAADAAAILERYIERREQKEEEVLMGKYDFDTVYLRPGQGSSKWDGAMKNGCPPDIVPLSVADMEFPSAPEIRKALAETAQKGFYGYTYGTPELQAAIKGWMLRRHGWRVETEWMVHTAGVVTAFYAAVRAFTQPGDRVLVQPPVYHPFFGAIRQNGREVLENPLLCQDGVYTMDLEDLEKKLPQAKMMILCSPHNPVGRVWSREELLAVGELCQKHHVLLFVDEIHSDLVLGPRVHTAFGTLPAQLLKNCVIGTAASKTFSLAGLGCSTIFLPDPELRKKYEDELGKSAQHFNSTFGVVATQVAYDQCEPWLEELLEVLRGNFQYLKDFLERHFPKVTVSPLEGTYLAWVDFRSLELSPEELEEFMQKEAKLYLNEGYIFGAQGAGFERINLACPRKVLEDSLERLRKAALRRGLIE